ncbi:hypothetical protein A9Q84_13785 [Halobacteriovorax marinus]|uniref:RelA/SpoT domain-containing protein n=1 Tax=Halobacteriovorax marinus TaxID=97084 RepID=A0A1Y5FD58_9BACT|nr:hypothetical protein A9Q84_13785 [Halobacteriovorax marinus]
MISKKRIDRIGEKLKAEKNLNSEELAQLLQWRDGFSTTLDYYFKKISIKTDEKERVTLSRRLKRIDSIKIKLKRFKTMRLSTLQDIAGLRVVVKSKNALDEALTALRILPDKHTLKKLDNYTSAPKNDGYRGVHLIYQNKKSDLIEVQLRTDLQHIWATAVETYGELQNTSFKTGEGDKQWKDFFSLLSSYFAILENSTPLDIHLKLSKKKLKTQLKKIIKDLKVIERLNATTNSIQVIVNKQNETGRMGKYAILELDLKEKTTTIDVYTKKNVTKAIKIYTEKELNYKDNEFKNIVFVNIEDVEKIQKSYPNYFLDTRNLLKILSQIVLDQL